MGKSSDHRSDVRERVTDANKTPLGKPGFFSGSKPSGSASLLKPSYMGSNEYSSSSSSSSSSMSTSYSSMSHQSHHSHQSHQSHQSHHHIPGSYSSGSHNSSKQAADYSMWSESDIGNYLKASKHASKRDMDDSDGNSGDGDSNRRSRDRRRKRSRWMGTTDEKAVIPGMPTILPSDLNPDQQEAYIAQLQIEELSRKLRSGDLGIPPNPEDRSPSPEPIYGTDGKRLNTREYRTRKKLEEDRHKLITRLLQLNPDYKPPADYRAPIVKIVDRVAIPQEEHPEINFVGLLIGPRGNTLKGLEKDTGAKIIIRGKGSVKEGKVGGKAGHPLPGEDEPLHAYVTSNSPDAVKKACEKIKEIIRQGIDMPESQNDLRKNQLRELALLNGTLREGEGPKCSNCGSTTHRTWHCPDKPNVTNSVICTVCGGAGHIAKDCRMKRPGAGGPPAVNFNEKAKIDEEYMSLMAELGEGPPDEPRVNKHTFKSSGSHNLFDKPSAPKAILPSQPSSNSNSQSNINNVVPSKGPSMMPSIPMGSPSAPVPPPGVNNFPNQGWAPLNQPPPPGDLEKNRPGNKQQPPLPVVPPPPSSWGYPPAYPPAPPMSGQQWQQWTPQPPGPVPPGPPGSHLPPPPGMYWPQGSGNFGMTPPPPPPDTNQPPPPPPS